MHLETSDFASAWYVRTTHSKDWLSPMDFNLTLYLRIDVDWWAGLEMQPLVLKLKEKTSWTTYSVVTVLGWWLARIILPIWPGQISSTGSVRNIHYCCDNLFQWLSSNCNPTGFSLDQGGFPYLTLGVTPSVSRIYFPSVVDGSSEAIHIPRGFPLGRSNQTTVFVR